jgi:hypothetical protein
MVAKDRNRRSRGSGAKFFQRSESAREDFNFVRNECRENPCSAMNAKRGDCVFELRASEVVTLEIDATEAVDLKIKETGVVHCV